MEKFVLNPSRVNVLHFRPQYQLPDRVSWLTCLAILVFACSVNVTKLLEYKTEVGQHNLSQNTDIFLMKMCL